MRRLKIQDSRYKEREMKYNTGYKGFERLIGD
jgi:hypothetical protein